ncbi:MULTISPECIES: hypothetical protein [unclassified Pseudoclavibacter]|uniref:hypothetical protein n=1 Tax=unclassified Pseudoclavibacter TaxID=2615177 RepID=UPI001BABD953|nr:hypothetical protein [Pseudoclavibacter sp. Marseille-Q4354]MBS3180122.1 hypothetical protein [Pseudoclavibacter sp. Marseille-Q4354]
MSSATPTPELNRRALLTAAAWSAPVIAVAVAAPLAAASQELEKGLQGWVAVTTTQTTQWSQGFAPRPVTTNHLTIDGSGTPPERGLWVTGTSARSKLANASITFYSDANVTWTPMRGNSGAWSTPTRTGTTRIDGVTCSVYVTTYQRPITATSTQTNLDNQLMFRAVENTGRARVWARRSITVDGQEVAFTRGPIAVG